MKKIVLVSVATVAIIATGCKNKNNEHQELKDAKVITQNSNFEKLLAYVPKDTAYLFGNKRAVPDEFRERQAKSLEVILNAIEKNNPNNPKNKLLKRIVESYKTNNFEDFGLAKNRSSIIYGLNVYPVIRGEITSPDKFINSFSKLAKEANTTIEWKDCSGYKCIDEKLDSKLAATLVVKKKTVAMSLYPLDKKDIYIKHLTGKADGKNSYSIKEFDKLLSDNNFKGYSDGFIKLKPVVNFFLAKANESASNKEELEKCILPMANDFTDAVDSITIGYKALNKDNLESEMIIHTNKNVATALKSIVSKNEINKVIKAPVMAFGLRYDAKNLSNAIMSLTNYTISEAKKYKCSSIKQKELLNNASSASMMLSMFGSQVSEAYVGIDKIEIDANGKDPKLLSALIEFVSPNPKAILGMLKAKSPELANINLPQDGTEIDLLKVLPKPSPKFVTSLTASLKGHTVAVNISKPETKAFKDSKKTLFWVDINNDKFMEFMKSTTKAEGAKKKATLEKLKKMGILNEQDYKQRLESLKRREETSKFGVEAITSAYPKGSDTSLEIYMDDRGIVFNTKQKKSK